jgi:Protein of unknown function (DUF2480)
MEGTIVNKVAESGLLTLDLEKFLPSAPVIGFDIAPFLFMGQILREKEFREAMQQHSWDAYAGSDVAVFCSADAILPAWAYMLIASSLADQARSIHAGTVEQVSRVLLIENIRSGLRGAEYADTRVVIKGCGDHAIGPDAYLEATAILKPFVKTLMYGEPCSTVPVYKKKAGA